MQHDKATCDERSYQESDLSGVIKNELRELVIRQKECWPNKGPRFNSHTTVRELREALLNSSNGFTTNKPERKNTPFKPDPGLPLDAHLLGSVPAEWTPFATVAPAATSSAVSVFPVQPSVEREQPYQRSLRLYIEDTHLMHPINTSVTVAVTMADLPNLGRGAWQVEGRTVLEKLQASTEEIRGPGRVKIGVPDDLRPVHTCHFVEARIADLAHAATDPVRLDVPAGDIAALTLRVSKAGNRTFQEVAQPAGIEDANNANHLPPAFRTVSDVRNTAKICPENPIVERLLDVICMRPGYQEFADAHGAPLQNPEIPPVWNFAAKFNKDYCGKNARAVSNELPDKRITKSYIICALDVKETWLKDAVDGDRLIRLYGDGGKYAAPAVIEELARVQENPGGRGKLLKFLKAWAATHTVPGRAAAA